MAEEAITPQEGTSPELELEVEETSTEEETEETPEQLEEEMVPKSQLNQAIARAHNAERELKKFKTPQQRQNITNQNPQVPTVTPEVVQVEILKSQGMSESLIKELQAVSRIRGKGLIESQQDPIFVAIKEKIEADERAEKSRLGASRGSGQKVKEKSINTPELSDAEHKELWKKQRGN